jgi:hypothetical protein
MSFKVSKEVFIHLGIIVLLAVIAFIYCKPVLENKKLIQHDVIQATGAAQEVENYYKKTGSYPLWTNSMFGGMPAYTIKGKFPNSWTSKIASTVSYLLPDPVNYIFLLLGCFYIAMIALGNKPLISLLGAMAFGFSSYSIISLEAGHASKVLAVAYAAPLAAGVVLLYRGELWKGLLLTSVFMMFELYSNHIQITYYLAIALALYVIWAFVESILSKQWKNFIVASISVVFISIVVLGSMATRFMDMYEYQKLTIRGPSELTPLDKESVSTTGLDRDYAFSWSYGVAETFNYLIPNFRGGRSGAALDENSAIYQKIEASYGKQTANKIAKEEQWPLYWGDQPNTSGPAYMGAIVVFLFVLAFFVVKSNYKWWMLTVVVLFTMLAWGKNFEVFNYFIFDHVPMYNKFRAVTMIHALVSLIMVWLAVWGISDIFKMEDKSILKKYLAYTTTIVGGFTLIVWLLGSSLSTFEKSNEQDAENSKRMFVNSWEQATQNKDFANSMYDALLEDRATALSTDALRSLIFIILAAGVLYFYSTSQNTGSIFQPQYVVIALLTLILLDEWQISKRYLNDNDFKRRKSNKLLVSKTAADAEILQDTDPNFRVMNLTVSTFNDATTSFYHKSIGGYSAVKLRRYQDLIDRQISKNNMNILNMLNTKYFIIQNPSNGEPVAQRNPNALGNAWVVSDLKIANNADEEMSLLDSINPATSAVISKSYWELIDKFKPTEDTTAMVRLTSYHPDHLEYQYQSSATQLVVFSEIYYNSGLGWNAYIDGKPVDHVRVNYILRGLVVPAGSHKIEFKFEPKTHALGEKVSLAFSITFILGLLGILYFGIIKNSL